ncbi:MAG: SRPBCC domain-containing protein [Pseudomonadota bacterium]
MGQLEIDLTYEVPFPLETVYSTWVSSDTVIPPATAMEVLPEVGGHYRLIMEGENFSMRNEGEFIEVRPNRFVHYTWEWNNDGEISHIEVTFSAHSDHNTSVRIFHYGFNNPESVASHHSGWDSYIEGFTAHIQGFAHE